MKTVALPDYLREPGNFNHYYGTLRYEDGEWIIDGEPIVCQMAKRLFPGSSGKGQGHARFASSKRTDGDLNWLMLRYPLRVEDPERWKQSIEKTKAHVLRREELNLNPAKAFCKPTEFTLELRDFQQEGLGFLLHNNRALLADEQGLGKTVQALAFLSHIDQWPAIIVVPPHLRTNWQKEIERILRVSPMVGENVSLIESNNIPKIHVIKGLKPYHLPEAQIYIIHYGLLRGWMKALPQIGAPTVIFDEIQDLRRRESQKYSAASLLAEQTENVIGLSGTPIYNKGGEIWNIMNIIEFHCMRDWESFTREWCCGYGSDLVSDPDILGEYLRREGLLLRRTKDQVLKELPPKRRIVQFVDADEKTFDNLIYDAIQKVTELDNCKDVLKRGRLTREIIEETRQATGIAKAPDVAAFVQMLLESGDKVILCAHHHAVFDIYHEKLMEYNPVFITGRQNQKQKDESEDAFMNGRSNLCCLSMRAASGLNLQRANCVVFGELDWSPAVHSQAEDRAHRMGQVDSVLSYYLVTQTGSDQQIQDYLGLKVSQFVGIMGDEAESEEDRMLAQKAANKHMKNIVENLKDRKVPKIRTA